MPFALVPFMLLVIPVVEIAAFIAIGGQIGIAATLLMIVVTAVIGTFLLRIQGLGLVREIQTKMEKGELPGRALGDGAMIVVAGILLLTPGFVTDGLGFLLFVPGILSGLVISGPVLMVTKRRRCLEALRMFWPKLQWYRWTRSSRSVQ